MKQISLRTLENQSGEISDSVVNVESLTDDLNDPSNDFINILIKFVNEKELKVKAKPNDTILFLKMLKSTYSFPILLCIGKFKKQIKKNK